MYDSLLFTYPNRTDLWSVYIDILVKQISQDNNNDEMVLDDDLEKTLIKKLKS
jgi:hypothetical protein